MLVSISVLLALVAVPVAAADPGESLVPGRPAERRMAAGEIHVYSVAAESGKIWTLTVRQQGIDLAIEIFDPRNASLGTVAGPLGRWDLEICVVDPPAPGRYRVEIRPKGPRVAPGSYVLELGTPDLASVAGRRRLAAEIATTSGGRRSGSPRAADLRQAFAFYRRAGYHWRSLDDRFETARATLAAAELSRRLGELEPAAELFRKSLESWRSLGERGWEAEALNGLGLTMLRLRSYGEARARLAEALSLNTDLGRTVEMAGNLMDLALIDQYRGALRRALTGYEEAHRLYLQAGHLQHQATLLNNIGGIHSRLGDPRQAMHCFQRALELHRDADDARGEATVLNNLAVLHRHLWQPDRALELYARVLTITRELGDARREPLVYNNIGYAYLELGELERASEYFQRALELRRQRGYRRSAASTLRNLGDVFDRRGDLAKALEHHRRALAWMRETGDRQGEMELLSLVGHDLVRLGDLTAARAHFDQALELLADAEDPIARGQVLHLQGETLRLSGEIEAAATALEEALELRRNLADRAGELDTLLALARSERQRGRLLEARDRLAEARTAVESLRADVYPPDLRAAFLGSRRDAYELSIEVLMELHGRQPRAGHEREALAVSERGHARGLLDLLAEAGAELEGGTEPRLRRRRRDLGVRLAVLTGLLDRSTSSSGLVRKQEVGDITAELADVRAELDLTEAEIRRGNPRYAALTRSEPLTAEAMQRLLGAEDLLLHYALGSERSFLWVLTAETCDSFVLPPERKIEDLARRAHRALRSRAPAESDTGEPDAVTELTEMVLGPVGSRLTRPRIIVVADGALHYVPFAALPLPAAIRRTPSERLVVRGEVVHLPSVSALATLRRPTPGAPTAAVIADPVFTPEDPRVTTVAAASNSTRPQFRERLRASRLEARAIAALLPPADVLLALDFDASLAGLGDLEPYRIVHFATHGEIDGRDPRLSRLVLSRVDRGGRPQDGDLRLADIYELELDAELVVLSGCETALGREIRGEGLVGLTQGFFYAGARRVVASLWQVPDQATAELMGRFYRRLLRDGLTPAASLRAAQLEISRQPQWNAPHYWAAFIVQGDWRAPAWRLQATDEKTPVSLSKKGAERLVDVVDLGRPSRPPSISTQEEEP